MKFSGRRLAGWVLGSVLVALAGSASAAMVDIAFAAVREPESSLTLLTVLGLLGAIARRRGN